MAGKGRMAHDRLTTESYWLSKTRVRQGIWVTSWISGQPIFPGWQVPWPQTPQCHDWNRLANPVLKTSNLPHPKEHAKKRHFRTLSDVMKQMDIAETSRSPG